MEKIINIYNYFAILISLFLFDKADINNLKYLKIVSFIIIYSKLLLISNYNLIIKKLNNKYIFAFLFMIIPAYVFVPIIFYNSYKMRDKYLMIKILLLGWFIVDNIHFLNHIKYEKYIINFFIILFLILFFIRKNNPIHYDDLHPSINIDYNILKKSKYIFVIPKLNNIPITNDIKWCTKLLNYCKKNNKILCLHGIKHTQNNGWEGDCEFLFKINEKELIEAINIFKNAFGFHPKYFKAPCYALSKTNEKILKKHKFKIFRPYDLIFNKVYHTEHCQKCNIINKILNYF